MVDDMKKASALWLSRPTDEDAEFTLLASDGNMGLRPLHPDTWMLSRESHRIHQTGVGTVILPGIFQILDQQDVILTRTHVEAKIYFMATGVPRTLDANQVDLMLAILKARTADAARKALVKLGILQDDHKISYTAIKSQFALTGMRHFETDVLPEFPRADMQSGSSQEGRPAIKRKKSRKLYRPKPALLASADALPEPPPKRSQRVLKPQKAKRSVFNR
ncbi:unnamed protein product [Symbiodinium sp. CCMP2456]|nr:unnamed protein product [Symbiodinium sp. CCMP2456]